MASDSIEIVADAILQGISPKELREKGWTYSDEGVGGEIEVIANSADRAAEVLRTFFPSGVPVNSDFYDKLSRFSRYFGFGEHSEKLVGVIWAAAFDHMTDANRTEMLRVLKESENLDFWTMIRAFPHFLPKLKLPLSSFADYLFEFADKIGPDLAGGPFFEAIELFAYRRPNEALEVLKYHLDKEMGSTRAHLCSLILGGIRSASRDGRIDSGIVNRLDDELLRSPITQKRLCYHGSWVSAFRMDKVSVEELDQRLQQMLGGDEKEISEAFRSAYGCLLGKLGDQAFVNFYIRWIGAHADPSIPSTAKYWVVHSILSLCSPNPGKTEILDFKAGANLLIRVQPIPYDHAGIWRDMEYFLVDALKEGNETFEIVLNGMYLADEVNLSRLITEGKLQYLESEMSQHGMTQYVFKLIVSDNPTLRKLGFELLRSHQVHADVKDVMEVVKPVPGVLKIILLESIRRPMLGEDTSQFFLALLPIYEQCESEVKEEFKREMVVQGINYPGACLSKWKELENPSNFLREVIERVEKYFTNLKAVANSPVNSLTFPGFEQAVERGAREQSHAVSNSVKQRSILRQFATTIQVIYGDTWTTYVDGHLGKPSGFQSISHSIEYPRIERIDPEGMAIRRLNAAIELEKLVKKDASH